MIEDLRVKEDAMMHERYIPGHTDTRFPRGSSLSRAWRIRNEIRATKTSRPLIQSPTHEFPSYTYTLHYTHLVRHEIMSRDIPANFGVPEIPDRNSRHRAAA